MPATDKTTENGGNKKFYYGVSEMQGWRFSECPHPSCCRVLQRENTA